MHMFSFHATKKTLTFLLSVSLFGTIAEVFHSEDIIIIPRKNPEFANHSILFPCPKLHSIFLLFIANYSPNMVWLSPTLGWKIQIFMALLLGFNEDCNISCIFVLLIQTVSLSDHWYLFHLWVCSASLKEHLALPALLTLISFSYLSDSMLDFKKNNLNWSSFCPLATFILIYDIKIWQFQFITLYECKIFQIKLYKS